MRLRDMTRDGSTGHGAQLPRPPERGINVSRTRAKLLLVAVFIARGTSFLFSKSLLQSLMPLSILAVRFLSAFALLSAIFHRRLGRCDGRSLRGGALLGAMYTVCMIFEMYGLRLIDSGVSALIENMAIVLVPLLTAALTRTRPHRRTMLCAVIAVVGVGFLSRTQGHSRNAGLGLLLVISAAVTYAACIMTTERVSRDADPMLIGIVQLGTMGALSLIAALVIDGRLLPPRTGGQWLMMGLLVLVCSCFGFAFQPVGQKYLRAEEAAVLTVVNPLTASLMGVFIAGEEMSASKLTGYVLILVALVLYNLHAPGEGRSGEA